MPDKWKEKIIKILRWSERYTKTDMVYLTSGGFWLLLGQITGSIASLFTAIFFAYFLPKETYGVYKYILSIVGMLSAFSLTGLGSALIQATARIGNGFYKLAIKKSLRWALIPSFLSIAVGIYYLIQSNAAIGWGLIISGVLYSPYATFLLFSGYLNGKKDFRRMTLFGLVPDFGVLFSIIVALLFTKNVLVLISTFFISSIITNYIAHRLSLRVYPTSKTEIHPEEKLSKHLSILNIFSTIVSYIDKILIFHVLGATQVAIYLFANAVPDQIRGLFKIPGSLALPKLAKTPKDIKKIFQKQLLRITAIYGVLVAIYILVAPLIYRLLFPAYLESIFYSQIIAVGIIGSGILILINNGLQARHEVRSLYTLHVVQSVSLLIVTITPLFFGGSLLTVIVARTATTLIISIFGYLLLQYPTLKLFWFLRDNKIT
jgi:O-antigen/teichoic acid export membrane protein